MKRKQILALHSGKPKTATQAIEDEGLALGDQDTPDSDRETVFELEWQLRDFIPPEFTRQTPNNQQKTVA
ncbi:hypothetical protein [Pseudomonas huaxiensis]|uniref:hypothetical protein n=1 Tax=Pseudomonas huaxiensis TaxID=2213017 RepID=UPI001CDBFFFE|nr:hypothetical protein [Pseudomonas huaxiensis]